MSIEPTADRYTRRWGHCLRCHDIRLVTTAACHTTIHTPDGICADCLNWGSP
jgi:hypothetical protein